MPPEHVGMQPAERLERGHRRARRRRGVVQRRAAALQLLALEPVEVRQAGRHAAPTRRWRRRPGASPKASAKPTRQQSARRRLRASLHPVSGGLDPEATFPARPIRGSPSKQVSYLLTHFPGVPTRRHDKNIRRCFCFGIFYYRLFSLLRSADVSVPHRLAGCPDHLITALHTRAGLQLGGESDNV